MLARNECMTFGTTDVMITSSTSPAAQPQELRDHQAIFIRRVVRLRGDAIRAGDMPVIEKADHHIGVADVDCDQKHVEFSLRLLY